MKKIIFGGNRARSTLLAGITAGATTLSVQSGHGARFKTPGANEVYRALLYKTDFTYEIVNVTAKTGDSFTIERAQEGTTAIAFNAGEGFGARVTDALFLQLVQRSELVNGSFVYAATDSGAVNAYAITLLEAPLAYTDGMEVWFKAGSTNTGAATINVNALGVKNFKTNDGADLLPDAIKTGMIVGGRYNGTEFRMISPHGLKIKQLVKDHGTKSGNYTLQLDEADLHLVAFSAAAQLTIASALTNDKGIVAVKNGGFAITLAGIDNNAPSLTNGASKQDFMSIVKSFGKITAVSSRLNVPTT